MSLRRISTRVTMAIAGTLLLFSVSSISAETVIFSGNIASGIQDLNVNGTLYDVEFVYDSAYNVYGDSPNFDFDNQSDAIAATDAVRAALNKVPQVTEVGNGPDDFLRSRFTIGYDEEDIIITSTVGWSGTYDDGTWRDTGRQLEPPFDSQTYADFTVAGGGPPPPSGVDLTGNVEDTGGTPLCSLVLASGQFTFTCNPNGPYSLLNLPRESNGTVKRQVYVDGFFPNVMTLPGSVNEDVVMTRANNCPDYNSFPNPGVFPGSAGKRINISGKILLQNTQTSICAMVLANGQFGFTCDGSGSYSGNIPLDNNGQYKLQVYAQGFAPMIQRFDEFSTNVEVRMARAAECQ